MGAIRRVGVATALAITLCLSVGPSLNEVTPSTALRLSAIPAQGPEDALKVPRTHVASRAPRHVELHRAPLTARNTVLGFAPPPIMAKAAVLVDMKTGKVLFAKNPDERLPMASTTKITTAVVALQHSRLADLAWVSKRAATIGESTMVLSRGERLTVQQLLYGLLLNSANDAAITLAEHVSGNEERFVGLMNALARRLHMRNTHYVTAHGLDEPDHYSSARDLSIVARYAMRNPVLRRIVATTTYYIPKTKHNAVHWLANVNHVLYWFPGVDGVKPGDTDNAGLCQVVSAWRNGRRVLAVLLNTPNLVTDIRTLLDYGGRDFRWVQAPAWWDGPAGTETGAGSHHWLYFLGAGHYVRDQFLAYFKTHGGLTTLGYPRTEALNDGERRVQFFQGGELVLDSVHHSVYPEPLGMELAEELAPTHIHTVRRPAREFRKLYRQLGGAGVLGDPVTGRIRVRGLPVEFFQYGELAGVGGAAYLVPVGDAAMRLRDWLPATGAPDAFPSSMAASTVEFIEAPRASVHTYTRKEFAARRHALSVRYAGFLKAHGDRAAPDAGAQS